MLNTDLTIGSEVSFKLSPDAKYYTCGLVLERWKYVIKVISRKSHNMYFVSLANPTLIVTKSFNDLVSISMDKIEKDLEL